MLFIFSGVKNEQFRKKAPQTSSNYLKDKKALSKQSPPPDPQLVLVRCDVEVSKFKGVDAVRWLADTSGSASI